MMKKQARLHAPATLRRVIKPYVGQDRVVIAILLKILIAGWGCPLVGDVLIHAATAQSGLHRYEYSQLHMGVQVRLVLYAPAENTAFDAASAAFSRIAELEASMSDYRPDSELMRLSRQPPGRATSISADFFTVLSQAQALARSSDGAFDATVGPLVRLWRRARRSGELPDPDTLHAARQRVGWQHLHLDSTRQTARLDRAGMQLDLGGIAKGYAAEQALDVLRSHGVTRALIEIGGDLAVRDAPPDRDGWVIEVPNAPADQRLQVLTHAAVSSSGDTEQFVEIDGTRYSHIVDPRTGLGLTHRVAVTVIGPSAFLSDGLSTTLSTLGPKKGRAFLETHFPEWKAYFRDDG